MKDLQQMIYEKMDTQTTVYFDNMASLCIFLSEETGQISDGKYENSRPSNHWEWVSNVEVVFDKNHDNGYVSNYKHRINYNIDEWAKYASGKVKDYEWGSRVLSFGKVGLVLEKLNKTKVDDRHKFESAVDFFEYYDEDLQSETVEELSDKVKNKNVSYLTHYFNDAKSIFLNDEFLKAYNEAEYTVRDLKADLVDMNESVNTFLGYTTD